jgi:hypothetical protein
MGGNPGFAMFLIAIDSGGILQVIIKIGNLFMD